MQTESTGKLFTRGGQIAFHNLRMFFQINKAVLKTMVLLMVVVMLALTIYLTPDEIIKTAFEYNKASILGWLDNYYPVTLPIHGKMITLNSKALLSHPYFAMKASLVWTSLFQSLIYSFFIIFTLSAALVFFFVYKGKSQGRNRFLRGAKMVPVQTLIKKVKRENMESDLVIDGVPMINSSEVQHFLIHGTIGTGKSQLMMKFLERIRQRGDRVIIYDKGCSFTSHFFDESCDVILNPFDERCANWDMWGDAPRDSDFTNMAESLIPLHGQTDPFWVDAARTVFASTAIKLKQVGRGTVDDLLAILLTAEFEQLEPFLAGTPAATLVSSRIEKTAISIRSVITTYLKSLQSLKGLNDGERERFTIRDYILNPEHSGWLFISSNGEQHSSLKPLISMWLAMASMTLLSLEEDRKRRIWFICDELPSLHRLPMLAETIAEVRKFGGCFMLGMQSFAQLGKVYGRDAASEIFDLLNTRFFFRSPSHDMASLVAKELGEEEIEESTESYSYGANTIRDGISVGRAKIRRNLVTYPEIMNLKDMECFLRLPGDFPVTRMKLQFCERQKKSLDFIERHIPATQSDAKNNSSADVSVSAGDERDHRSLRLVSKEDSLKTKTEEYQEKPLLNQIKEEEEIMSDEAGEPIF
ncbi:type IV conjugative transfer system coupling protein TraD (plasmid) [Legionella sp. D16C41]|uniref:type IV conjugative transfer system coupling protein TraD n=1 Tax=Legionella sp. D16C41 TaxID=3402688 RepID=UPI003AF599EC